MSKLVDWAKDHTASTIWSCLAAHAAVLHSDGIERRALEHKLFGVFDCRLGRRSSDDGALSRAALGAAFALQRPAGSGAVGLRLHRFSPVRIPPASTLSPSRTAASFCSSRAIRNTRPIRFCANTAATSYVSSAGEREHYPALPLVISMTMRRRRRGFRHARARDRRRRTDRRVPQSRTRSRAASPWRAAALGTYEKWALICGPEGGAADRRRAVARMRRAGPGAIGRLARAKPAGSPAR